MDSAIAAFQASGARLKIREGIFMVSVDTLIPASPGTAAASLSGAGGAEQGPDDLNDKPRRYMSLEYGVRAGAERGTASATATKFIAGPYIKIPLNKKVSLSAQPAIRLGMVSGRSLGTRSYYSNTATSVDSVLVFDTSGTIVLQRKYIARQQYDASTISHTMARRLLEFELPVLMHYNFTSSFSMFGGFMLSFGKVIDLETKQAGAGRQTITNDTLYSVAPIPKSELESATFKHTAEPLSNYKPGDYANPGSNPVRVGYMLGLSYKVQERINIDLAMQQMLGGNFIPNTDVRKVYTQPYFRLMINYRLGKTKK